MQLADRTLILKQKEFFVFIIATRLLWNHSPSEWFSLYKKPGRFPGRALGHMGLTAQNLISLPFLRHCLNSATAVNSASDEELMAVSSES